MDRAESGILPFTRAPRPPRLPGAFTSNLMTIGEHLKFIADALKAGGTESKATVEIAADAANLPGRLATAPGSPRLTVMFAAEQKRRACEETGAVDRHFLVVVSRGRGLTLQPGNALTEGASGGKPLYDLVEETRETLRNLRLTQPNALESVPDYQGTRRFPLPDSAGDAYQIEFSIGTLLPNQSV